MKVDMSYQADIFNVMIASPGDVNAERAQAREVIHEWNAINSETRNIVLLPTGWELNSAPLMGGEPQSIINEQILHKCDLLVGIFWTRIGTATTDYASGTVEEIEKHAGSGKPVMLYFSSQPAIVDPAEIEQYKLLGDFKKSCKQRSLYESYEDLSGFRNKFSRQLSIILNTHAIFLNDDTPVANKLPIAKYMPDLSYEAKIMLEQASYDAHGFILHVRFLGGTDIQTNGIHLIESNDPREVAKWESAIQELLDHGFISPRGLKGETYQLTALGYTYADSYGNKRL